MKKLIIIGAVTITALSSLAFAPLISIPATLGSVAALGGVTLIAHELITQPPAKRFGKNGEGMKIAHKVCRVFARHC